MKETFYLYCETPLKNFIKDTFVDFHFQDISLELIINAKTKNKNILLVTNHDFLMQLNKSIFLNNNLVFLFSNKNKNDNKKYTNSKSFYGHLEIKKFVEELRMCFSSNNYIFRDLKLKDDKIYNIVSGLSSTITPLEKNILIVLFEKEKTSKNYFLENVLKIKKDTETKTIESHLTRIRKKLLQIKSTLEIASKEDVIFLSY